MDILFIFWIIYAAVAGLLIGSFLNVLICRIPLGETVVRGRSKCRACGRMIAWYDNLPLVSYILLRGKCRRCKAVISPRYPLVEGLCCILFLLVVLRVGPSIQAVLFCLLCACLLAAAFLDHDTGCVPDGFSLFIALLGIASLLLLPVPPVWERLLGAVIVSVPMLLFAAWRGGFGGADIKLIAACGLLLGFRAILLSAFLASVSAGIWAILLLLRKKATRGTALAFVPHLAFGVILSALFYDPLIQWYLSLFM